MDALPLQAGPRNGRQLFFRTIDRHLMVVDVRAAGNSFTAGKPEPWSDWKGDVTSGHTLYYCPDPKRPRVLVVSDGLDRKRDTTVNVALNFFDENERRLRAYAK